MSGAAHPTTVWSTEGITWNWKCHNATCPAKRRGYRSEAKANRIAAIHQDPSASQGSPAAATKN